MTQEQQIDKIKKLLELSSSPNEHEATLAYAMAVKLMEKYCLSFVDLETEQEAKKIVQVIYIPPKITSGLIDALPGLVMSIGPKFGVYCLVSKRYRTISLVGFATNCEVVKHALDCIINQGLVDFRIGYSKERSISFGPSFWLGFREMIFRRFTTSNEESASKAMVVYDAVKEYMASFSTTTNWSEMNTQAQTGLMAGLESGANAQIRPGVQTVNTGCAHAVQGFFLCYQYLKREFERGSIDSLESLFKLES